MSDTITHDPDLLRGFHLWLGEDGRYVSCLTCGALGQDVSESVVADVRGADGEPIAGCSTDTMQCHHYVGECPYDTPCNLNAACNCHRCH